jgi:hypothetical protein
MNQPAVHAQQRPRRKGRFWLAIGVALTLLLAGAIGLLVLIFGAVEGAAARPWAALHEAAVAAQSPATAEAYYRGHPGLAGQFPTAEAFVGASHAWAPKLAELPPAMPGLKDLIKGQRSVTITSSRGHTTLTVGGRAGTVTVVLVDGKLVDLQVQ